jgi:hypothetical protein
MTFNYPITANIGQYITQTYTIGNTTITSNATVHGANIYSGNLGNVVNSYTGYFISNNSNEFSDVGNISINALTRYPKRAPRCVLGPS